MEYRALQLLVVSHCTIESSIKPIMGSSQSLPPGLRRPVYVRVSKYASAIFVSWQTLVRTDLLRDVAVGCICELLVTSCCMQKPGRALSPQEQATLDVHLEQGVKHCTGTCLAVKGKCHLCSLECCWGQLHSPWD